MWHAGPFNWQPENMAPDLFDAGIDLVRHMDHRFYNGSKNSTVMSVRDVIYVTRSVIPFLVNRGITGKVLLFGHEFALADAVSWINSVPLGCSTL